MVIFGLIKVDFFFYCVICNLLNLVGFGDMMCFVLLDFFKIVIGFGELFIMSIKVCFIMGLIIVFFYVLWEFWKFIKFGLYFKEWKVVCGMVGICLALFMFGVLFGYYIILLFVVNFLVGY